MEKEKRSSTGHRPPSAKRPSSRRTSGTDNPTKSTQVDNLPDVQTKTESRVLIPPQHMQTKTDTKITHQSTIHSTISSSPPMSSPLSPRSIATVMSPITIEMLQSVSLVNSWSKAAYLAISEVSTQVVNWRKWSKSIGKYYNDVLSLDVVNVDEYTQAINQLDGVLEWWIKNKFKLNDQTFDEIIDQLQNCRPRLLTLDDVVKNIPVSIKNKLIDMAGMDEFIALCLRYYVPLSSEGLFLSIDSKMYSSINNSSKLPVIEWCASPFNNNLSHSYCSLFDEDKVFGAWPRFDKLIDFIDFPCRLCINPPYTFDTITLCVDKLLKYMSRQRGEFIMILPEMFNFNPLDQVLKSDNTAYELLTPGTYVLHSFLSGMLTASMNLYLIVNVGGSERESKLVLNDLVYHMRQKACSGLV
jgi:hypothetical protein